MSTCSLCEFPGGQELAVVRTRKSKLKEISEMPVGTAQADAWGGAARGSGLIVQLTFLALLSVFCWPLVR